MMNEEQKFGFLSVLLRAPEAAKNYKALAFWMLGVLLAVVVGGIGMSLSYKFFSGNMLAVMAGMTSIIALLIALSTFSGVGLMLMDQAHGIDSRNMMDALIGGLLCVGKTLLVMLLDGVFVILFLAVCALLLYVCKIPGLGPVLYLLIYPAIILATGLLMAMFLFVVLPMTLPAIWEGNSVMGIYARRWGLFKERVVQVFISQIGLSVIVGIAATIIFTILSSGFFTATSLSVPIIGSSINFEQIVNSFGGMMQGSEMEGGGYFISAALGAGFLFIIASLLPALIAIYGMINIYLRAVEGLDFAAAEANISSALEDAKRRAEEAKARATEASQRAREAAARKTATPEKASAGGAPAVAASCPGCSGPIAAGDVFCGDCGYKLNSAK